MTPSGNFQVQLRCISTSDHRMAVSSLRTVILNFILKVSTTSSLVKDLLQKENFSMEILEKIFN